VALGLVAFAAPGFVDGSMDDWRLVRHHHGAGGGRWLEGAWVSEGAFAVATRTAAHCQSNDGP
jgi:hypothetical protein